MAQSKLKSVSPKLDNEGNHKTWEGKHGAFFIFDVEFENGDKGDTMAKTNIYKHKLGTELSYQIEETEYGNKIKGIKDPSYVPGSGGAQAGRSSGGGYKGGRMSQSEQDLISYQVAMECAIDCSIQLGLSKEADPNFDVMVLADEINAFMKVHVPDIGGMATCNAMRRAIQAINLPDMNNPSMKHVYAVAVKIVNAYKQIKNG